MNVFVSRLFETHPVLQTRFKGFAGKSSEQLRTNKRVAAHGSSVLLAITGMVDNLDDVSCLVEMLKTTGRNHVKRGIPKEDFEVKKSYISKTIIPPIKLFSIFINNSWLPPLAPCIYQLG